MTHGKHIKVWHAPDHSKEFAPFSVHRTYTGLYDDTVCIDWSSDSRSVIIKMGYVMLGYNILPCIIFYKLLTQTCE